VNEPTVVVKVETVFIYPSDGLLITEPIPPIPPGEITNQDLIDITSKMIMVVKTLNTRIMCIREFKESHQNGVEAECTIYH